VISIAGTGPWLVVVTGWTGTGKSTLADLLAGELGATVASFDWLMSALRSHEDVWAVVERPEVQRRVGWDLLSRVAEQQLRAGRSCILDLVAREQPRGEWSALARARGASFAVVECTCSDLAVHRSRVEHRNRAIPGWYELEWAWVERGRQRYEPLRGPKVVVDAVDPAPHNLDLVLRHLAAVAARHAPSASRAGASTPTTAQAGDRASDGRPWIRGPRSGTAGPGRSRGADLR
jgi:predicted kinase